VEINDGANFFDRVVLANPPAADAGAAEGDTLLNKTGRMFFKPLLFSKRKLRITALREELGVLFSPFRVLVVGGFAERFGFRGGENLGRDIAQIAHDVHDFVIAEHDDDLPAGFRSFGLEEHHQVQNVAFLGAAVDEIPRLNQDGLASGPVTGVVDQSDALENVADTIEVSENIADGKGDRLRQMPRKMRAKERPEHKNSERTYG
jgi:hypothetical protein